MPLGDRTSPSCRVCASTLRPARRSPRNWRRAPRYRRNGPRVGRKPISRQARWRRRQASYPSVSPDRSRSFLTRWAARSVDRSDERFPRKWDQRFESPFLQRRVSGEPDFFRYGSSQTSSTPPRFCASAELLATATSRPAATRKTRCLDPMCVFSSLLRPRLAACPNRSIMPGPSRTRQQFTVAHSGMLIAPFSG